MNGYEVKEVMDQVHISSQMQEEIMMNIQKRMEHGNKNTRTWNLRKTATAAAAFVLAAGIISFPVRALVSSAVKERMESVPKEEMESLNDMVQSQHDVQADGFSREYSDREKERMKALWQAYENGTFPEHVIAEADNAEDAQEGALCYIKATGVFNLPAQEMTDEEMLEIIDFQHKMSYAVEQGSAAQEVKAKMEAEEERLREAVRAAGGISQEEAIEIGQKQMETALGKKAEGKEILRYEDGSVAVWLEDISEHTYYEHQNNMAYRVEFYNPSDHSGYSMMIDAVDGSVLYIDSYGS